MDNLEVVTAILILVILYLLLNVDKQKLKEKIKAKKDERELVKVFQDIDATPEDIYQSISTLAKLAQHLQQQRPDLINLVLNIMSKNNTNSQIQHQALKCLNRFKKKLDPITDQKLRQQINNVTLMCIEKFPTDIKIQKNSLALLWDTKGISFDKWHCLKLLLNMLSILEEETQTLNALRVCDNIFYSIPFDQRDIYADISDNWKQTWLSNTNENAQGELRTMRKTLAVLWNICSLPSRHDQTIFFDLQFFTEALQTFTDDPVTQQGIFGILHNISCKKQFAYCFLTPNLMPHFLASFQSDNFSLSYAASKVIVKLLYHATEPWPDTVESREFLLQQLKQKIVDGWKGCDVKIIENCSFDFNCVVLLQCDIPELQLYSVWFISNMIVKHDFKKKLEKYGVVEIVREKAAIEDEIGVYCKNILLSVCSDI